MFHCSPFVKTQQKAELEALVRGVRLCSNIGWPVWRVVGDSESALSYVSAVKAGARLKRQNKHLCRPFYLLRRLESSVYLSMSHGTSTQQIACPGLTQIGVPV